MRKKIRRKLTVHFCRYALSEIQYALPSRNSLDLKDHHLARLAFPYTATRVRAIVPLSDLDMLRYQGTRGGEQVADERYSSALQERPVQMLPSLTVITLGTEP
jgi:hypothetical protein